MADPAIQAFQASPEILSGAPIPFRFEVTWRSLTRPLRPTRLETRLSMLHTDLPRPAPEPRADAREWEMVLPRMRRPAALPAPAPEVAPPPARPEYSAPLAAPQFSVASESNALRRPAALVGAALMLAFSAAAYQWMRHDNSAARESAKASMEMGGAGWISEWASDSAGSARGRQITLYRPSIAMSDYRMEFLGRIQRKSLGWVFRAANSSNYYVAKLEAARPGASPLTITRFAVMHGVEGLHIERTLALIPAAGSVLRVRLEARGPRFTVYVQNQVVEDWEDDRLKSGGLGFLNERDESGQVGSIRISFPKGGMQ